MKRMQQASRLTSRSRGQPDSWSVESNVDSVPSTRSPSATSTRATSRCSSDVSYEGSDATVSHNADVLRRAVLDQVDYPVASVDVPASSSRMPVLPKQAPCARPSALTAQAQRLHSVYSARAKQSQAERQRMRSEPPLRKAPVENIKATIKERKDCRRLRSEVMESHKQNVGIALDDEDSDRNKYSSTMGGLAVTQTAQLQSLESCTVPQVGLEGPPSVAIETLLPDSVPTLHDETDNVKNEQSDSLPPEFEYDSIQDVKNLPLSLPIATEDSDKDVDTAHAAAIEQTSDREEIKSLLSRGHAKLRRHLATQAKEFPLSSPKVQAARETFQTYDKDGDGMLNVAEFGTLLRNQGLDVTFQDALEAIRTVTGQVADSVGGVDFDSFKDLLARAYSNEKLAIERRHGFSAGDADFLQMIFDKYDTNRNKKLEGPEIARFLEDAGYAPKGPEEQLQLRHQLEQARGGVLGPLSFKHFLALFRLFLIEHKIQQEQSEQEAASRAGLSKEEVEQLKDIFDTHARGRETLGCSEVYDILRHGLPLHAAEGQLEKKVHGIIELHSIHNNVAAGLSFQGFMCAVGEIAKYDWTGGGVLQDPSPMNISQFRIRSVTSVVAPITAALKLRKAID